jgi:lipopolysaccharide/colanic/teichoic acid biosynthesis glycosyltransferase
MKRIFDIIISFLLLIFFSPILLIVAICVYLKLGKPIFYNQKRPGKNEEIFLLYKFRSMSNAKDGYGNILPNDKRISTFGKFLRSTSLDELPALLNVLKGDMSLVGPRPLLIDYLEFYNSDEKLRHSVLPGITGLAQINGRNEISWEDKFKLDIWYVKNQSLLLDFKILILTLKKVFIREGINQKDGSFMIRFDEYVKQNRK